MLNEESNRNTDQLLGKLWRSSELQRTFQQLCQTGGRLCGTASERAAVAFLKAELGKTKTTITTHKCTYSGWQRELTRLQILDDGEFDVATASLQNSPDTPPGGIELEVVDVGRGSFDEFKALKIAIKGRAVVVRHEYFFTYTHTARRRKYGLAKEFGAEAFLIANYLPGAGIVNGVVGQGAPDDIPSAGISFETAEWLSRLCRESRGRVRMEVKATRGPAASENLIAEVSGRLDEWVVLSAHYDGQHLGQSAMDNASGTAVAMEVFRTLAPAVSNMRRGLRLVLFTLEHWGFVGSSQYVQDLAESERRKIALAINVDTVGGGGKLYAVTSGVEELVPFINAAVSGRPGLNIIRVPQLSSDHYSFHLAGIPSLRLGVGFEEPDCNCKFMMSPTDTSDKVNPVELASSALTTAQIVVHACNAPHIAKHLSSEQVRGALDITDPWVKDRIGVL